MKRPWGFYLCQQWLLTWLLADRSHGGHQSGERELALMEVVAEMAGDPQSPNRVIIV